MTAGELRELCQALDVKWPVTLAQLEQARRLQAQFFHPDRHSSNEELRRQGEARLKRANDAYDRLRKIVIGGGGALCSKCGDLIESRTALCETCQRESAVAEREKRMRQRETELNATARKLKQDRLQMERARQGEQAARSRTQQEMETPLPRSPGVVGTWFNSAGMQCFEIVANGSRYEYRGGPLEQGTVAVSGNTVTVRGQHALTGEFTSALLLDGRRLHGMLTQTMFGIMPISLPVEYWRQ